MGIASSGSSKAQEKYFRAKTPFVLAFSTGPVFRFDHPDILEGISFDLF